MTGLPIHPAAAALTDEHVEEVLDAVKARADVERLTRERDEYAAESRRLGDFANAKVQEIKALRGQRIVAAVFGHHKNAPRPFALHRPGFGPIADGVEFSDGRIALRELRQGLAPRVTTYDRMATLIDGHPDDFGPDGVQIVWLSDELEPLAEMEADRDRLADTVRRHQPVIDAAKAWRQMRLGTPTQPKPEAFALIEAMDALDDAGQVPPRTRHGERLDGAYHAPAADGAGETEQCPQRFDCPRCRCVLDAGHPGPCDQHCGQPEEVAEHG